MNPLNWIFLMVSSHFSAILLKLTLHTVAGAIFPKQDDDIAVPL